MRRASLLLLVALTLMAALLGISLATPRRVAAQTDTGPLPVALTAKPTFRAAFSVNAQAGDFAELRGVVGTVGRVVKVIVGKPSVAATIMVSRRSSLDTGGAVTPITLGKADTRNVGGAALTLNAYTAAPAQGTVAETVFTMPLGTSDVWVGTFGDTSAQAQVLRPGEAFALTTDTPATIFVTIEETEEKP